MDGKTSEAKQRIFDLLKARPDEAFLSANISDVLKYSRQRTGNLLRELEKESLITRKKGTYPFVGFWCQVAPDYKKVLEEKAKLQRAQVFDKVCSKQNPNKDLIVIDSKGNTTLERK